MRLRSPLFAPGDSDRKMTKAIASAADAVILDLEDSVAAPAKPTARAMVPDMVRAHPGRGLIVRVNPRGTPWYLDDLAAVVPARRPPSRCRNAAAPTTSARWPTPGGAGGGRRHPVGSIRCWRSSPRPPPRYSGWAATAPSSRLLAICFGAEDLSADLGISRAIRTAATRRR
jgi:citrate lyase subunit beta/citryl-CoA lyase